MPIHIRLSCRRNNRKCRNKTSVENGYLRLK